MLVQEHSQRKYRKECSKELKKIQKILHRACQIKETALEKKTGEEKKRLHSAVQHSQAEND